MTANPLAAMKFEPGKDMERIPLHSYDLIRYLADQFPQKCMVPGENDREHLFYAGAANLASILTQWMEDEIAGRTADDDDDAADADLRRSEPRRVSSPPHVS